MFLKLYSFFKLPLLFFVGAKVVELNSEKSVVRIKLGYRTRNHLNVMYFGALGVGAELSIAIKAVEAIQKSGKRIDFIFKDFKCQFLKRADSDVHFVCQSPQAVQALIDKAATSPDRIEETYQGYAFVPKNGPEPVMSYELTLSVKNRGSR